MRTRWKARFMSGGIVKPIHLLIAALSASRALFQGLLKGPHDFLEPVPLGRRPDLGPRVAQSPD